MPLLIVRTLGELAAFVLCALVVGSWLVSVARRVARTPGPEEPGMREGAVRILCGLGGIAYVAVPLGLAHALHWWVLAPLGAGVLVAGRAALLTYARALRRPRADRVTLVLAAAAAAMASGQLLAALAPPEAYDELAYHLPIARAIESGGAAQQLLHSLDAYGNLPSLGESLYAAALAVDGPALAHAVQFAALLSLVALAAAVVRELCGGRAGALVAVGLLAYPDLVYLGTTAYVDALATSFEVGALLLVVRWLERRTAFDLPSAALLLGFALSVKYTALFTAVVLVAAVAITARRRGATRLAFASLALTVTACGFWYAKNLVRFGNPFWPFYFGHRTMDDRTYANFVAGIHAFGPRTLHGFLEVPWRLAADRAAVPFVALSVVVLALAVRRARPFAAYAVVFVAYWFWLASHQVRFLLSGGVVAIIAVTVALAAGGRSLRLALAAAALAAVVVAQTEVHPFSASAAAGAVMAQLGSPKSGYAVGLLSRDAYFRRYVGCEADAVAYLDARPALSPVLVPQTVLAPWFARTTRFGKLPLTTSDPRGAIAALRAGAYRSVLVTQGASQHLATTDPSTAAVRARLTQIWAKDGCTILRIGWH